MRGKCVIVTPDPKGNFQEGIVKATQTFYPGMAVVKDPSIALVGGRHTYKYFNPGTDGEMPNGAVWIVTEKALALQGLGITDSTTFGSYAAGERVSLYAPLPGDELNLLFKNVAGTADDVVAGNKMTIDDSSGKFQVTSATPESEPALALEAITDPTADTLFWAEWTGH